MGTLFDQPVRTRYDITERDLERTIDSLHSIADRTGWSIENILKLYKIKVMNRAVDAYISNGDIHDEQMTGIGKLFQELNEILYDKDNIDVY